MVDYFSFKSANSTGFSGGSLQKQHVVFEKLNADLIWWAAFLYRIEIVIEFSIKGFRGY